MQEMWEIYRVFTDQNGYVNYAGKKHIQRRCRYLMEMVYGKARVKGKFVHHINLIRDDDDLSNLLICTMKEHMRLHKYLNAGDINKYEKLVNRLQEKQRKYLMRDE